MNPSVLSTANGSPTQSMTERPHLVWGAPTAAERGPVIATLRNANHRNAVGSHAGGYSVYRALAIAARTLAHDHIADLTDTAPVEHIGPHPQWCDAKKIVSLDPWGHLVGEAFRDQLARGYDIRPTIAVSRAHIDMPEIRAAIAARRIDADGGIVSAHGSVRVMKAAIDPVWYLPGIAERFGLTEADLRRGLHEQTGGMYPELVSRPDLKVFRAADRRHPDLLLRRSGKAGRWHNAARLPRARRVQRLRCVRLRHLHLPALSLARHRDRHSKGAGGRRRARGL